MKQIIGRKAGMTQVFAQDGKMYAVTVIEVLPNVVTQVKTVEKDGYAAIKVGYNDKAEAKLNKCDAGQFKKNGVATKEHLGELKGDEMTGYTVGQEIKADIFKTGDVVDVLGTSKGKGFSGSIKRYHHKIGPKGHGSGFHRGPGSFANNGRCNNRVIPGKKMAGHAGNLNVTVQNLVIVAVDVEHNAILVKGGVPGANKSYVTIRSAVRTQSGKPEVIKTLVNNIKDKAVKAEEVAVEQAAPVEAPKAE